jgi:hypothetical protein
MASVDDTEARNTQIDDSAVVNALRPVAVCWKSYLHPGSNSGVGHCGADEPGAIRPAAGERAACLHNLLDRVSTHPASRVEDVSPARRELSGR